MLSHRYPFADRHRPSTELFLDAAGASLYIGSTVRDSGPPQKDGTVTGWEYGPDNSPVVRIEFAPDDIVTMTPEEVSGLTLVAGAHGGFYGV